MPSYLERRYRKWYVTLDIPKALRPKFGGKRRFVQSLKTESRTVADRAKLQVLAEWQRQLERARTGNERLEFMLPKARALAEGATDWIQQDPERAKRIESPEGFVREFGQLLGRMAKTEEPNDLFNIALGDKFLLSEFQDRWASRGQVREQTKKAKLQQLRLLTKRFRYAHEVTTRPLLEWVENDLIAAQNVSSGTLKNYFGVWREYWTYLQRWHGLDQQNPFASDLQSELQRLATKPVQRQIWEPEEFKLLLEGLEENSPLHSLIQLAAYTGLRRNVLCTLKLGDIQEDRFTVHKAKYEAVSREFPIHSQLIPLFDRMKAATKTEYLFGITEQQSEKFSHSIGERFRVYKNRKGFGEGKVFHSFRHTVATQLHKAEVPDYVVDLMLGWSVKGGSTGLRTYTKADFQIMKQAIETVSYD